MINIDEASGRRRLLLLGIAAFLLFAVLSFPASLALKLFLPDNIPIGQVSGTIWSAKVSVVQLPTVTLTDCKWRVRPLALLSARLSLAVDSKIGDGAIQSIVSISPGGTLRFKNTTGVISLSHLSHFIPPNFIAGRIGLDLSNLRVQKQWVTDAHGTVDLVNLQLTSPIQENLGSFELLFDGAKDDSLQGTIREVDGPLVASGILTLNDDRSWLLNGSVKPEATASPQLTQALSMLGARKPDGSYPLSAQGSN